MTAQNGHTTKNANAGGTSLRRLCVYNGGFLWQPRLRHILAAGGYRVSTGRPGPDDLVAVWGASPTAHRGEAMAAKHNAPLVRIEDAFLRSLFPGRKGEPPLGLLVDHGGLHFDAATPSDLETLLNTHPLDDSALLDRARGVMARMAEHRLSKYSATDPDLPAPAPGYVLVVDQTRGDASVRASNADRARFLEMLFVAREENPGARIVVKTHPETSAGLREGHFRDEDMGPDMALSDAPLSPWALLEGATKVYTVSSQMGFEAILAGHKPRVFGTPFYAGWGLSEDEAVLPRRTRRLTRAQLTAAAMILLPIWYDPHTGTRCEVEHVLGILEARTRAWREDRHGWVASGARLWKRGPLQEFFGRHKRMRFEDHADRAQKLAARLQRPHMVWARKATQDAVKLEDGFLRSRGLGAQLVPPLSLVLDPDGIYFDPTQPSRLETLIQTRAPGLRPDQTERIRHLIQHMVGGSLSKYNISGDIPSLPPGHRILVPGQVEDDASILTGSPITKRNAELLERARDANPDAVLIWKPHPDVEAGLREGKVEAPEQWADLTLGRCDIGKLLQNVDEVWTMTSLTGFEALLRGCRVTTLGVPFYAGWGLTRDLGPVPERRHTGPRPDLNALVYATLIDYPRYFDPALGEACPVETVIERLKTDTIPRPSLFNRTLSTLQGLMASHAHLWRG